MKRGCEVKVESLKADLNKGDEEKYKSHKYKANPKAEFWKTIKKEK